MMIHDLETDFEPKPITEENSSVRKSCLSISWIYENCEDCDQDLAQCYNEGRCILNDRQNRGVRLIEDSGYLNMHSTGQELQEKHNEFHTDISDNGTRYRLTFITTEKNNFLEMQDLARKFIDGKQSEVIDEFIKRLLDAFPEPHRGGNLCPAIYYDDYREIIEECAARMTKGDEGNERKLC